MQLTVGRTKLAEMARSYQTDFWADTCSIDDLQYSLASGAVGATANPTIVVDVWKTNPTLWRGRAADLARTEETATEVDIAWWVVEEMSLGAARLLEPVFHEHDGKKGRLSIQTDPTIFRNPDRMLDQARHFDALGPNIMAKLPATSSGIAAIEEATYCGVTINCTVCFSVSQAVAAAEAVERGLLRREAEGLPTNTLWPVVTIMVGRVEDWLRVQSERDGIVCDPASLPWSGVAVFKRAYGCFRERNFRARLLAAAIRHHYHWSEFIGGDVSITISPAWQRRLNNSNIPIRAMIDRPVSRRWINSLSASFPDFVRAYEPGALDLEDFDDFPPSVRTLRQFIRSYHELLDLSTNAMLPDPDVTPV